MKHFVIISGGTIDDSFADRWFEEEKPDAVIAADAGMEYLYRSHRVPDVIVWERRLLLILRHCLVWRSRS